jgi:hypothetical protein
MFCVISVWFGAPASLTAHPISMSTAVADIYQDRVQIELRILTEDLMFYHSLEADGDQVLSKSDLVEAADAHRDFLTKYFRVLNKDGKAFEGNYTRVDTQEIPEEGVRLDQVMEVGVFYELHIPLKEIPDYLTFAQNFGGDDSPVPAVMDLIMLQNGARLDFPVQIGPRSPHSVAIDWENPPRNDRMYWRERRDLMKKRREELLGITSYSSTYAYIYVEPYEIRFEILVPLLTLETWLPLERDEKDFLSVKEQEELRKPLETYIRKQCQGWVDGIEVVPVLSHLDFFSLDIRDFASQSEPRTIGMQNGRAGIIMAFSTKGKPKTASIEWSGFNDFTPMLNTMVYVMNGKGERHFFTENEPRWDWQSEEEGDSETAWLTLPQAPEQPLLKLSFISIVLGGISLLALIVGLLRARRRALWGGGGALVVAGALWPLTAVEIRHPWKKIDPPSVDQQKMISEAMLKNVYRAFDYKQDEQVYDALARSASGSFLEDLYLQIKKGLIVQDQGGARSHVREVRWVSGASVLSDSLEAVFELDIRWEVTGTVEHWGHIHTRQHAYDAVIQVIAEDGQWKMGGMEVKSEEQLKSSTGLRNAA